MKIIEHRAGSKNGNADALSRRICVTALSNNDASPVNWPAAQRKDPSLKLLYQMPNEGNPKLAPEVLTAHCAVVKNVCRLYDNLEITNNDIPCRRFYNNANGQTHKLLSLKKCAEK